MLGPFEGQRVHPTLAAGDPLSHALPTSRRAPATSRSAVDTSRTGKPHWTTRPRPRRRRPRTDLFTGATHHAATPRLADLFAALPVSLSLLASASSASAPPARAAPAPPAAPRTS